MYAKDYRPIILKTLKTAQQKFKTLDALADHIVSKMEDYEEMADMLRGQGIVSSAPPQPPSGIVLVGDMPESPGVVRPTGDIYERIGDTPSDGLTINFKLDDMFNWYRQNLPPMLKVQPPGFTAPIDMQLSIQKQEGAYGGSGQLSITYTQPGSGSYCRTMVSPTDPKMDAAKAIAEIKQQAASLFRPAPVSIKAMTAPPPSSLEAQLSGSPSLDTDSKANAEDAAAWGQMLRSSDRVTWESIKD